MMCTLGLLCYRCSSMLVMTPLISLGKFRFAGGKVPNEDFAVFVARPTRSCRRVRKAAQVVGESLAAGKLAHFVAPFRIELPKLKQSVHARCRSDAEPAVRRKSASVLKSLDCEGFRRTASVPWLANEMIRISRPCSAM